VNFLPDKFLIDKTIKNGLALVSRNGIQRAIIGKRLVRESFIDVTLQNDVSVHGRDYAINDLGGVRGGGAQCA
jgi:hypothetical protein